MKLSEKDLAHLMRLLQSYSYKWNPIGLSLGFTPHELYNISCMVTLLTGAPVSYLQELLSQWVQWPTEEHQNNPTLGALCTALRSSLVGLGSLAEEVEKEMKQYAIGKKMHQNLIVIFITFLQFFTKSWHQICLFMYNVHVRICSKLLCISGFIQVAAMQGMYIIFSFVGGQM